MFESMFPLGISHYLAGGLAIGAGVSLLFLTTGLVGSMSTFFTSTLSWFAKWPYFQQSRFVGSRNWRLIYAVGLVAGASLWGLVSGAQPVTTVSTWQLVTGGFIAGFGARLSNGCTSGHGICGVASLQWPSVFSVLIFLATAMITAGVLQWLGASS